MSENYIFPYLPYLILGIIKNKEVATFEQVYAYIHKYQNKLGALKSEHEQTLVQMEVSKEAVKKEFLSLIALPAPHIQNAESPHKNSYRITPVGEAFLERYPLKG